MAYDPEKSVLLIGNHPPPFGGVPSHIASLAPFLANRGWKVTVLSQAMNPNWGRHRQEQIGGYEVVRPTRFNRILDLILGRAPFRKTLEHTQGMGMTHWSRAVLSSIEGVIFQICKERRVGVIASYKMMAGLQGMVAAKQFKLPLILTVFGDLFSERKFFDKHRGLVEKVHEASSKVLSCSQHCADSFKKTGFELDAECLHYGVDVEHFNPQVDTSDLIKRIGLKPGPKGIFVGRMVEEMGLQILIKALPKIFLAAPDFRMLIVGGRGELTPEARIAESRFPENIRVFENLNYSDLPKMYRLADFAVVPSINERACLGLAIAEANAVGRPALVSNIGGGPEVVVDGRTGFLFSPNNFEALADRVIDAIHQIDKLKLMELACRERAVKSFNQDVTNLKMEQYLLEAMGSVSGVNRHAVTL